MTEFKGNQTYWWRVRAHNAEGWGPFSDVWTFSTYVTSVDENEIPHEFSLSQNYPNPFNPQTLIRYGLPQKAHVRLEVYNILGERIALLLDMTQEAGYHEALFDGHNLASGLYFYRIRANDFVQVRKLLLLR